MAAKKRVSNLDALLGIVRRIAYDPRSGLDAGTTATLRNRFLAVVAETAPPSANKPTLYDLVVEDPFKG